MRSSATIASWRGALVALCVLVLGVAVSIPAREGPGIPGGAAEPLAATATLLTPSNNSTTQNNIITFTWTGDGHYYELQYATNASFEGAVTVSELMTTSYTVTQAIGNRTYWWRVLPFDNVGYPGAWTPAWSFQITGAHVVPSEFPVIQNAISAFPINGGGVVEVEPGTYTGTGNYNISGFGDRSVTVRSTDGPATTIINLLWDLAGFSFDSYTGAGTTIEGFTLRGAHEAAFLCQGGSATIRNCVLDSCFVAAYVSSGATPTFEDCVFRHCYGTAVSVSTGGHPTIRNCQFERNWGRAVYIDGYSSGSARVVGCTFNYQRNYSETDAVCVYLYDASDTANVIDSCTFTLSARSAIYCSYSSPVIKDCEFLEDTSAYGAAIYCFEGNPIIKSCSFIGNFASYGGAIYCTWGSAPTVDSCLFDGNTAAGYGGGMFFEDLYAVNVSHSTFVNNAAKMGAAITAEGEGLARRAEGPYIEHCVIANSTSGGAISGYPLAELSITCTDLYNNVGGDWSGDLAGFLGTNGNISANPWFCAPSTGNYTIAENSPCAPGVTCAEGMGRYAPACPAAAFDVTPAEIVLVTVPGSDPEPDTLHIGNSGGGEFSFTLSRQWSWLSMSPTSGTSPADIAVWATEEGLAAGEHYDTIAVTAPGVVGSPFLVPVVFKIGSPPTIDEIVTDNPVVTYEPFEVVATIGDAFMLTFHASDPDGTIPFFTLGGDVLPGASFTDNEDGTAQFTFATTSATPGASYDMFVVASDSILADTATVLIDINRRPDFLSTCSDTTISQGETYSCEISATDEDDYSGPPYPPDPNVALTWNGVPTGASFLAGEDGTASFIFTPGDSHQGAYLAVFTASDQWSSRADTIVINVESAVLTVLSFSPTPSMTRDVLVNTPLYAQFSKSVRETSLSGNVTVTSARSGASLPYSYNAQLHRLVVSAVLLDLDTITMSIGAGVQDSRGVAIDEAHSAQWLAGATVCPGDANDDGIVDERDILPIGSFWGDSGPGRGADTGLALGTYLCHAVTPSSRWTPSRAVYADCDGSGTVDSNDICGVSDNWQQTSSPIVFERIAAVQIIREIGEGVAGSLYNALCGCDESEGKAVLMQALRPGPGVPGAMPEQIALHQNYPNPFNPSTTISYELPGATRSEVAVFDITGRRVAILWDGPAPAGANDVDWNGTDDQGRPVASGIYFYRLEADGTVLVGRMVLLK